MAETKTQATAPARPNKLKQSFAALVWRVNRQLQWFQGNQSAAKAAPKRRVACLVVARGLYSESWQTFNIRSQRALQKVLKQKYGNRPNTLFFIGPWQQNQRRVLLIELNPAAQVLQDKAYTLLPESMVLSAALPNGLYEIADGEQVYYLHKQEQQWQTLLRSQLVNSLDKARLALGCSATQAATQLSYQQVGALTPRGVSKLGLATWQQGYQQQEGQAGKGLPWQQIGITLGAIGGIYLLVSSAYLYAQAAMIESKLEQITPEVAALLDQQQQLQRSQQAINELSGQRVNDQRINAFWQVFIAAQADDNNFTYLQANDSKLVMGGTIPEALPLLSKLYDLPSVKTAEFGSPLRNSRLGQQYRIEMELADDE
ncbi:hypothetical protein [Pseudidiomarina salilacus]|uniref:hypothetical protein n=1 Tax=Pseudidiomarina salilacus TaxID=3384452 RepID=UPI003984E778